ncbi:hypothetical protein LIER_01327 [Lithospermum erythrorhizon]|uniref:Uncharacterized protein n=1 Tax=Lithospermum erythrorhizon TaxID=34254 RepID=A0AAV3NQ32_LITER
MAYCVTEDQSEFLQAAYEGNLENFLRLVVKIDEGVGLARTAEKLKDGHGRNAFLWAASGGQTHICRFIVDYWKLSPFVKDNDQRSALHWAASGGHNELCKYLLEDLKFDSNIKDKIGTPPLFYAMDRDRLTTAEYLIEKGADITINDFTGYNPLHIAAERGHLGFLQLLTAKGAKVDVGVESKTPLMRAAARGMEEGVKFLLENNANPNTAADGFLTPLMLAIFKQSPECVELLLKAGADPNGRVCGTSALGVASYGNINVIKSLLKAGANPNNVDDYGFTPLEHAAYGQCAEAVVLLFPVTAPLSRVPGWSLDGFNNYKSSGEACGQGFFMRKHFFQLVKSKGDEAAKRKDQWVAIQWYNLAINIDPTEATVFSNRSFCWAQMNDGTAALLDALMCRELRPDWAKAYYREGLGWKLLGNLSKAIIAFTAALELEPNNNELRESLRDALEADFGTTNAAYISQLRI